MHLNHMQIKTEQVTVNDYKIKVQELYANTKSVSAWGGEDNDTPFYGRVYISINPKTGSNLTHTTKDDIVTQLKKVFCRFNNTCNC